MSDGRPRVLYVAPYTPHTPSTGGVTRSYYLLQAAAGVADVTLLSMGARVGRPDEGSRSVDVPVEVVQGANKSRPATAPGRRGDLLTLTRSMREPNPYTRGRYNAGLIRAHTAQALASGRYDLVVVDGPELSALLGPTVRAWGGPSLAGLELHSTAYQRELTMRKAAWVEETARAERSPLYRLLRRAKQTIVEVNGRRAVRLLRQEDRAAMATYRAVFAVSHEEAAALRAILPSGAPVAVVPNGVDVPYFAATSASPLYVETARKEETIVFTGALSFHPNVDGVVWFVETVWPLIRARRPEACLLVVGRSPVPAVAALDGRHGVSVYPDVADVRPYLAAAALSVAPLRLGSGARLKILDALAAGLPVVSTTVGAEGLALVHERDLLLADEPSSFAAAVLALLDDPARARTLARHGQGSVRNLYSWETIAAGFQDLILRTPR